MPLPRMTRLVKMKTVDVFSLRSARRNTAAAVNAIPLFWC
jgi:hypothetical protein